MTGRSSGGEHYEADTECKHELVPVEDCQASALLDGWVAYINGIDIIDAIKHRLRMVPISTEQNSKKAYNSLMIRFLANVVGMRGTVTQLPSLFAMFHLDSIRLWRYVMENRFCIRTKEHCKDELEGRQ